MANERYGVISADVGSQVKYKLNLTKRLGLSGHFLIVWDIMEHAKRSGVTAQGRGLAANSIVASVSGITKVDPTWHSLLLGLFLNEDMASTIFLYYDPTGPSINP